MEEQFGSTEAMNALRTVFEDAAINVRIEPPERLYTPTDVTETSMCEGVMRFKGVPILLIVSERCYIRVYQDCIKNFLRQSGISGSQFRVCVIPAEAFPDIDLWMLVSSLGEVLYSPGA